MTLTEALESMADRVQAILSASPKAATVLLNYPELLEKEPVLQDFVKKAAPQPRWNNRTKPSARRSGKSQQVQSQ